MASFVVQMPLWAANALAIVQVWKEAASLFSFAQETADACWLLSGQSPAGSFDLTRQAPSCRAKSCIAEGFARPRTGTWLVF